MIGIGGRTHSAAAEHTAHPAVLPWPYIQPCSNHLIHIALPRDLIISLHQGELLALAGIQSEPEGDWSVRPILPLLEAERCESQVLAGAGPAVAAVPLVVVWAGGSAVSVLWGLGSPCLAYSMCTAMSAPAPSLTVQRSMMLAGQGPENLCGCRIAL